MTGQQLYVQDAHIDSSGRREAAAQAEHSPAANNQHSCRWAAVTCACISHSSSRAMTTFTHTPAAMHTSLLHFCCTGLGKGGQQIQSCRKAYLSAIQLLVQLANLQTAFMTLDTALKVTNRRVNALENVVKPKIENTIAYIKVGCPGCAQGCDRLEVRSLKLWLALLLAAGWQGLTGVHGHAESCAWHDGVRLTGVPVIRRLGALVEGASLLQACASGCMPYCGSSKSTHLCQVGTGSYIFCSCWFCIRLGPWWCESRGGAF